MHVRRKRAFGNLGGIVAALPAPPRMLASIIAIASLMGICVFLRCWVLGGALLPSTLTLTPQLPSQGRGQVTPPELPAATYLPLCCTAPSASSINTLGRPTTVLQADPWPAL